MAEKVECVGCSALILPTTAEWTGGLCMPCKREGPSKKQGFAKVLSAQAPRLLKPFVPKKTKADVRDKSFEYEIACRCGGEAWAVNGGSAGTPHDPNAPGMLAPIRVTCTGCNREELLFDPREHGYDGEYGNDTSEVNREDSERAVCAACSGRDFRVRVWLAYALDPSDLKDSPALAARPQDFFTSISVHGACAECGAERNFTWYEELA